MPPTTPLTADEYERQAYLRREMERIDEDMGERGGAGIQQEEEARQAAAAAAGGASADTPTKTLSNLMPGSFISTSPSDATAAAAAAAIPEAHHHHQDPTAPPTSLAAKHVLLLRLHSDLGDKDYIRAVAHCLELMAQLRESLAQQMVFLDSVGTRNATELAMARLALATGGWVVGEGGEYRAEAREVEEGGEYRPEAREAEEGFAEGWEDDDDDDDDDDKEIVEEEKREEEDVQERVVVKT